MRPEQMIDKAATRPIEGIVRPFQRFAARQVSGGLVLLGCTAIALLWANSPWAGAYARFWHVHLTFEIGPFGLDQSLRHWINDGLMVLFFFVVGLEIKRELLVGELSSPRLALLPIVAAIGGMLVPATLYVFANPRGDALHGWGIPMATDIAFALGILALLGDRVPTALKVFLTGVAIVDDLGAIIVIAIGYTENVAGEALIAANLFVLALVCTNRFLRVRSPVPYALLGVGLWMALLKSGVHATLAGVVTAVTIPARTLLEGREFVNNGRRLITEFERREDGTSTILENERRQAAVLALEVACEQAQTPLQRLERAVHPWVTFLVMPLFVLANAGIPLQGEALTQRMSPVMLGVLAGLLIGKQVGVTLFAWIAVRTGAAVLPRGTGWRHIYAVSWLAGIGFTMSIFIGNLAFGDGTRLEDAKFAILAASLLASIGGLSILSRTLVPTSPAGEDRVVSGP